MTQISEKIKQDFDKYLKEDKIYIYQKILIISNITIDLRRCNDI